MIKVADVYLALSGVVWIKNTKINKKNKETWLILIKKNYVEARKDFFPCSIRPHACELWTSMGLAWNEMDMNYLLNQYLLKRLERQQDTADRWHGPVSTLHLTVDKW